MSAIKYVVLSCLAALITFPCRGGAEYDEAVNLIKAKKYTVAITLLEAELKRTDTAKIRYALGYCAEKSGKKDEAVAHYGVILTRSIEDPSDPENTAKAMKRLLSLKPAIAPVLQGAQQLWVQSVDKKGKEKEYLLDAVHLLYGYALNKDPGKIGKSALPRQGAIVDEKKSVEQVLGYRLGFHKWGSKNFGGHYYKLFEESLTWVEAQKKCKDMGGYLATVSSKEENDFLAKYADGTVWIGMYLDSKDWKWVTGEGVGYTNWWRKPRKLKGRYVTIADAWKDNPAGKFYPTNGVPKSLKGFICEWEK